MSLQTSSSRLYFLHSCGAAPSLSWGGSISIANSSNKNPRTSALLGMSTEQQIKPVNIPELCNKYIKRQNFPFSPTREVLSVYICLYLVKKFHSYAVVNTLRRGHFLSIDTAAHYKWSVVCRLKPLFSSRLLILICSQDPLALIILKASLQHCINQYLTVDFHVTSLFWRHSLWNWVDL